VPASIVPEGVAVLFLTIIWTACRALLSGRLGLDAFRRVVASTAELRIVEDRSGTGVDASDALAGRRRTG